MSAHSERQGCMPNYYWEHAAVTAARVVPMRFEEHTDLYMTAIADAANSNVVALCAMRGWLE